MGYQLEANIDVGIPPVINIYVDTYFHIKLN